MSVAHQYGFVRVIAFILKLLAWVVLGLGVVGAVFGLTLFGRSTALLGLPGWVLGSGTMIGSLLAGILWFVPLYAFGSILSLLLNIEESTRALAAYPPALEATDNSS